MLSDQNVLGTTNIKVGPLRIGLIPRPRRGALLLHLMRILSRDPTPQPGDRCRQPGRPFDGFTVISVYTPRPGHCRRRPCLESDSVSSVSPGLNYGSLPGIEPDCLKNQVDGGLAR